ncbi:hypothetical protein [Reyranella sp.]|uniref:hypothetical protein n=1 Tax=Reyranella sp. TaxID=1929291 RepID=UPI003783DCC4
MKEADELVEQVAEAIYDAPGPDGGSIAAYISDSARIDARTHAELVKGVMDVCRCAARAALAAIPGDAQKPASRLEPNGT